MGALSPRLVCMDFAIPWLLQCPKVPEEPYPLPQNAPATTTNITLEPPPSSSDLTPEALLTSHNPPLKRPLDQLDDDDDYDVHPAKKPTMATVAMETGKSSADDSRVDTSLLAPPTSDEEVAHGDVSDSRMCENLIKEESMIQTKGVCIGLLHDNHAVCPH